jgi:potassium/hydrogen antiporter
LFFGLGLSTVGVVITAVLTGLFATLMLHLSLLEGLLLGAIVSATDAAAVFTVLRAKSVGLTGNLTPLIELESGSNDPMAVFLTIGITSLLTSKALTPLALIPMLVIQMALGAALGYGLGKLGTFALNHLGLEYEGLYPVFTVALVLLIYGTAALVGGNGFLATYLAGVVVGNSEFVNKRSILRFHDGVAWLMQIAMFLTLGLLVFPSRLLPVAGIGLILAVFLTFIARPVAVFAVLSPSQMSLAEKAMVSWVGLRGAAPIVLATFPLLAGVPQSALFFDLVFFIVLTSVLLQGTTVPLVAKLLRLEAPSAPNPPSPC